MGDVLMCRVPVLVRRHRLRLGWRLRPGLNVERPICQSQIPHLNSNSTPSNHPMQAPLGLNVERLATRYSVGDASFAECVDFSPEHPAKLHLIPRGVGTGSQSERMCGD